jgi:transposase
MAMLVRVEAASKIEIGEAFGVHRNTVARLNDRLAEGGLAAVVPAKRGPKGPSKVGDEVRRVVLENSGMPAAQVSRLVLEQTGVKVSDSRIWQLRREAGRRQVELPIARQAVEQAEVAQVVAAEESVRSAEMKELASEPAVVVPTRNRARYLGAALYYPALQALGLLEAARECFRLPNSELFGVRAISLTLFYLSLLGKQTVEAAKHLRRWEFGPLVGSGRAPAVKTLRRKLAELVKQAQASHFAELLSRRWVEQGFIATAYLYVDGHMKIYTGKRKLAEIWNSQRRMPLPGVLNYFVNAQHGRPLLFVTEEANARLRNAMPRIVAAIRDVLGDRRFTVIFDRGGYDGKLYNWLREQGIDFITYQRGNPKLARQRFRRHESRFEGHRVRLLLAEDWVRVGKSGPWRRIVIRTKDGKQTPILTSLSEIGPARIACLILARWRQENFFRYMREHHGLDQLLGYASADADNTRLVANPDRKALDRQISECRKELAALQAELGGVVLKEPRSGRSVHGLKIAQRGAIAKLRSWEARLAELVSQRAALPRKVPVGTVGKQQVMRLEQKAIIDRIKITAYNAEAWLLDRLIRHYPEPHDVRDLLRSFAELSGEISTTSTGVVVTLDPPDTPQHRRALRGLCDELNEFGAVFPGTDLRVSYALAVHHSEVAA